MRNDKYIDAGLIFACELSEPKETACDLICTHQYLIGDAGRAALAEDSQE